MQFGHTEEKISDIDFSLPPDPEGTRRTLSAVKDVSELQVYVGASKWGEKTWLGKLYPPKTPDKEFLSIYSQSFNTVEFGPSFYTVYTEDQLAKWVHQVNAVPGFKFCPRFPQAITHIRRLMNAEETTARFYESLTAFDGHLGPLMLQLGEKFTPKSFSQLKGYLSGLPPTIKVVVEVRHPHWYSNAENRQNLFQLLRELNIGTVISDTAGRRDAVHMELTTSEAFIRFVGNNLAETDFSRIDAWVERLNEWKDQGLKKLWFFMHQDNESYVPEASDYLIKRLNEDLGITVARPKLILGQ